MNVFVNKRQFYTKAFFLLMSFVFVGVVVFGASFSFGQHHKNGEKMGMCPLMADSAVLCAMNLVEHIETWQSTFSAPVSQFLDFIMILFGFAALLALIYLRWLRDRKILDRVFNFFESIGIKIFDFKILVFAKGILHARLYA